MAANLKLYPNPCATLVRFRHLAETAKNPNPGTHLHSARWVPQQGYHAAGLLAAHPAAEVWAGALCRPFICRVANQAS